MPNRTTQELWKNYLFLTQEMIKFLKKPDMNLFYELMDQRERLQTIIEQADDKDFRNSTRGQSLLVEIQQDNKIISNNLQLQQNSIKKHHQVLKVYSGASMGPVSRLTWKR